MASQQIPYHADYDLEAELADERYARALKRITVDEVLSEVHSLLASEGDLRKHPLYALAKHVLRHGGYWQTGQRTHMSDFLTSKFEDLIEEAVERLVQEELASGVSWED
jgi:hypothetical protein